MVFADVFVKVEVLPLEGVAREAADEALVALLVLVVVELLAPARGARGGRQGGVREGDAPDNDVNEDCLTPAPKTKSVSAARQAGAETSAKCFSRLLSCQCRTLPNSSPLPQTICFPQWGSETMSLILTWKQTVYPTLRGLGRGRAAAKPLLGVSVTRVVLNEEREQKGVFQGRVPLGLFTLRGIICSFPPKAFCVVLQSLHFDTLKGVSLAAWAYFAEKESMMTPVMMATRMRMTSMR